MNFLIDTCVISEIVRKKPESSVLSWLSQQREESIFMSVLTIGEIKKGIHKLTDLNKQQRLQAWLEEDLLARFDKRMLGVDAKVATVWGKLQGESEKTGISLPIMDSLIAATALAYQLTVVTRNIMDMQRCQVDILNPWQA